MANVTISGITTEATGANGADWVELEQAGTSKKISVARLVGKIAPAVESGATYTVQDDDVIVNINTGTCVVTLPLATGSGRIIIIRKINASIGDLTISRAGSDTIDGSTSFVIKSQYGASCIQDIASGIWSKISRKEQGSFTPIVTDGTNNAVSYTASIGSYILTDNICSIQLSVQVSDFGSVGNVRISGLPFDSASVGVGAYSESCLYISSAKANISTQMIAQVETSDNFVRLFKNIGQTTSPTELNTTTDIDTDTVIRLSIIYRIL